MYNPMQQFALLALVCLSVSSAFSQTSRNWNIDRQSSIPTLDGQIDDPCWKTVAPLDAFLSARPVFGRAPHCPTQVRIFYTETALWISAYCFDPDADGVRNDGGIRDGSVTGDWFKVRIDTWNDDQLSFDFGVTAAGVQFDSRQGSSNWNAAWQSAVARQADGWTLEMCIPFTALRFPRKSRQTWGFQCERFDRSTGETSTWSPQDPLVADNVLQFGTLTGLYDLVQQRRLSVALHSDTDYNLENGRAALTEKAGVDARIGLNESATLDFTVLPPTEYRFDWLVLFQPGQKFLLNDVLVREPRQFLEEERDLFDKSPGLNYAPILDGSLFAWRSPLDSTEQIYRYTHSKLLQATKFSARTKGNWRFGAYNALLGPAGQEIFHRNNAEITKETLQRLSDYNFVTAEYVLPNNSYVNLSNTSLLAGPGVAGFQPQLSFRLRDRSDSYQLQGRSGFRYSEVDSATKSGYDYQFSIARINRRWGWSLEHTEGYRAISPPETNTPRLASTQALVRYQDLQTKGFFQNISASGGVISFNYSHWEAADKWTLLTQFYGLSRRFQEFRLLAQIDPRSTRLRYSSGGAYIDRKVAPVFSTALQFSSDNRKELIWNASLFGSMSTRGEYPLGTAGLGITWVLSPKFSLEGIATLNAQFQRLTLLTTPLDWTFERNNQYTGSGVIGFNWYPSRQLRLYAMLGVLTNLTANREAVILQTDGQLVPTNQALPTVAQDINGQFSFGLQWYFTPLSQIRVDLASGPANPLEALPLYFAQPAGGAQARLSVIYNLGR